MEKSQKAYTEFVAQVLKDLHQKLLAGEITQEKYEEAAASIREKKNSA